MQLLLDLTTTDFAAWKREFDADAENRRLAGLTLLQIWRGADEPNAVACLFQVNDRGRAQAWLDKEAGFGAAVTAKFLNTA
jgi:hypothetical protein